MDFELTKEQIELIQSDYELPVNSINIIATLVKASQVVQDDADFFNVIQKACSHFSTSKFYINEVKKDGERRSYRDCVLAALGEYYNNFEDYPKEIQNRWDFFSTDNKKRHN